MARWPRWARRWMYGLIGLLFAFLLTNCGGWRGPGSDSTQRDRKLPPLPQPLPAVVELSTPELPDWIEQISPMGESETRSQIRIRFAEPLIPLESLESGDRQALLDKFEVFPNIPGQFRFLTPRMVGFQADRAIPQASRLRVTLKSGLTDLAGHQLDQDLAWTFTTHPIEFSDLPGKRLGQDEEESRHRREPEPIGLEPTLEFTANAPLDLSSLQQHLSLAAESESPVAVRVVPVKDESRNAQARFDTADRPWRYHVAPKTLLRQGTDYTLTLEPGIQPAGGNLATTESVASQVETYAPLAFQELKLEDYGGRFAEGQPQLLFNNGLVAASAVEHISISPEPREGMKLVRTYDGDRAVSLNTWALEPNTAYQITMGAGLEDKFGQTLGEAVTVDYKPGDLQAEIWAPSGLNVFPSNQDVQLNLSAVNLPEGEYKAAFAGVEPTDLITTNSAYPRSNRPALLPDQSTWDSVPLETATNEIVEISIPLREQLGGNTGMLAYGMTARTTTYESNGEQRWQEPEYYGLVQLTNLGVFAQWFPESGLVRVNHLSDGESVENATVEIYRSYLNQENPPNNRDACATGKTGTDGTVNFSAAQLKTCMGGADSFAEAPNLLVIAREGSDWAHVHSQSYSGTYGYGMYAGWDSNKPQSRGTVFSDRFLYQPGETAWLTGSAYYLQQGELRQDKNTAYQVKLRSPEGAEIDLGRQTTNDFGTFSLQWDIAKNQPLGYYKIEAQSDGDSDGDSDSNIVLEGELRIAEFKPPNFQVDLSVDKAFAAAGDKLSATVQSDYLFGAPVQNGAVNYYVTRRPAELEPQGWDDFSFGPQWYWPEEKPVVTTDVLEMSGSLDELGQGILDVSISDDLPYPMTYRIDAEVVDASNLSVSGSQTVTALPSQTLVGLQNDFVADAGKTFKVRAIATNPQGEVQTGQSITLTLEKINYSSVTQLVEGSATPKYQVEYEPVTEKTIKSGKAAKVVELTAIEPGPYRIRATVKGKAGGQAVTDSRIWVSGARPIYWGSRYNNNRLEVRLDKEKYAPGETATAFIESPYEAGELYLAVVRHDRLYEKLIPVQGGAPQVQFTVTPEMLPNAAVEAVLVRQGEPLETLEPASLDNLVSVGFEPFEVDLAAQYLDVAIAPSQAELLPAAEQTLNLTVKDHQGQPVQKGQFTVMVVDEAVLQLSGHRPPDLVETVYAEQDISTRFADNRPEVVLQTQSSPLEKGWGYGGGFSAGGESTRLRRNFLPLAYYNGSVLTDNKGEAQVKFTLPDNLTTWRVMAVATDGELHFGQNDTTFVTTQPLITAPVLPQFARPGDRFQGGLSVTNTTDQTGRLQIQGTAVDGLTFKKGEQQTLKTRAESGTQAYRFPMTVGGDSLNTDVDPATGQTYAQLQFKTQLGNEQDAFELPLPIVPLAVTEQVVESGSTEDSVTIPLNIEKNGVPNVGGLDIFLSSTVLSDIQAPIKQLEWNEALPNLSHAASRLAIAAHLKILSQQYGSILEDFDPDTVAQQAIERLQTLQQPAGGFSSWPGFDTSDPFVTPYAAEALGAAKIAGISVDGDLLTGLQRYLSDLLTNPGQVEYCDSDICKSQLRLESLGGLAALGSERQDFLADLYRQREQLDDVGRIKLARHLARFENWKDEAEAIANALPLYETGRSAIINLPDSWRWFHSPTVSQAEVLKLSIERGESAEVLKRLTEGLLGLRRDGTWPTPYDNAQALAALVAYAQQSPEPPNFKTTVQLKNKTLASQTFKGYQRPSLDLSVTMAELPQGKSDLSLNKSGNGVLHYLTAYRYRPQGNPAGRLQGLRISRAIQSISSEDSNGEVLYQLGLSSIDKNLKLDVGQVYDIGLEIITDHPVNHVVITDPLPAGLEPVDTQFQTSNPSLRAQRDSWEIDYQELGRDRILAYAEQLDAGVYTLHYLVRSVTPGTFLWPGSEVQLEFAPEELGRSTTATVEIQE